MLSFLLRRAGSLHFSPETAITATSTQPLLQVVLGKLCLLSVPGYVFILYASLDTYYFLIILIVIASDMLRLLSQLM